MPLLVGSLRRASTMVMSMEGRAFGTHPQRTFVDAPRMGPLGVVVLVLTIAAVAGWYLALALGYVHAIYVFAPV
jgi:energy-coupling factor transport system permease protein